MSTLLTKLETLYASLSPDEQGIVEAAGPDAGPEQYPPELRAKLEAMADELSPAEREALVGADDDVEGFMISQPRVAQPGAGNSGLPGGAGGGFDPIRAPEVLSNGVQSFHRGLRGILSGPRS